MGAAVQVLQDKGLVTNEEIKQAVEKAVANYANAKSGGPKGAGSFSGNPGGDSGRLPVDASTGTPAKC